MALLPWILTTQSLGVSSSRGALDVVRFLISWKKDRPVAKERGCWEGGTVVGALGHHIGIAPCGT